MAMGIMIISALKIVLSAQNTSFQCCFSVDTISCIKCKRNEIHCKIIRSSKTFEYYQSTAHTIPEITNAQRKLYVLKWIKSKNRTKDRPTDQHENMRKRRWNENCAEKATWNSVTGSFYRITLAQTWFLWMYYVMLLPQCVIACYGLWGAINSSIMNSEAMTFSPVIHIAIWHQMLFHISCQRLWLVIVVSSDRNGYEN